MNKLIATACVCLSLSVIGADRAPATVTPEWVREEIARQVAAATNALYLTINYGTTNLAEIARIEREQEERRRKWEASRREREEKRKELLKIQKQLREERERREAKEKGGYKKPTDPAP